MNRSPILAGILAQVWPILLGQLASIAYVVIDTMMTGHASPADLAAMGLGASVYAVALWGLGLVGGYTVAFGSALGGPRGAAGMWLMQSVALCLTSLLLLAFYFWVLRQGRPAERFAAR